jgi:endoglycosylceramidase
MAAAVLVGASCAPPPGPDDPPVVDPGDSTALTTLRVRGGPDPAVVDAHGREVQLRGANLNHLGDYFESHPDLPTVSDLDTDDWEDLAALGFTVVRLVTSWSAWEPARDAYDDAYAARVRAAVEAANDHGLWVVIDLHQDAWSRHVHTPRGETCPPGTRPQIGWDGAPAWATFTDGAPTCTPGRREASPAVVAAWGSFYADREGIRREAAELWGHIASQFSGDPGVAGYDLLNEPGPGPDPAATIAGLTAFYREALAEIRSAETAAGVAHHLVFFEPTVDGEWVSDPGDDPQLVFAPHSYAEAIGSSFPGALELQLAGHALLGSIYGTPVWIGEYGSFADADADRAWMSRSARAHDANGFAGGTWWQWEQECGDPHDVAGAWPPDDAWVRAALAGCDGSRMPVACPTRSFPRAAPGRVASVVAEPCGGDLEVRGSTPAPSTADLWVTVDGAALDAPPTGVPSVTGEGVGEVEVRPVDGGWRVFVQVSGDYAMRVAVPAG